MIVTCTFDGQGRQLVLEDFALNGSMVHRPALLANATSATRVLYELNFTNTTSMLLLGKSNITASAIYIDSQDYVCVDHPSVLSASNQGLPRVTLADLPHDGPDYGGSYGGTGGLSCNDENPCASTDNKRPAAESAAYCSRVDALQSLPSSCISRGFGSGGNDTRSGFGGGTIVVRARNVSVAGTVAADGGAADGPRQATAGSGGTVVVDCHRLLMFATGAAAYSEVLLQVPSSITANGGRGKFAGGRLGAGGGGRLSVTCDALQLTHALNATADSYRSRSAATGARGGWADLFPCGSTLDVAVLNGGTPVSGGGTTTGFMMSAYGGVSADSVDCFDNDVNICCFQDGGAGTMLISPKNLGLSPFNTTERLLLIKSTTGCKYGSAELHSRAGHVAVATTPINVTRDDGIAMLQVGEKHAEGDTANFLVQVPSAEVTLVSALGPSASFAVVKRGAFLAASSSGSMLRITAGFVVVEGALGRPIQQDSLEVICHDLRLDGSGGAGGSGVPNTVQVNAEKATFRCANRFFASHTDFGIHNEMNVTARCAGGLATTAASVRSGSGSGARERSPSRGGGRGRGSFWGSLFATDYSTDDDISWMDDDGTGDDGDCEDPESPTACPCLTIVKSSVCPEFVSQGRPPARRPQVRGTPTAP
jgi:hypothetical protein